MISNIGGNILIFLDLVSLLLITFYLLFYRKVIIKGKLFLPIVNLILFQLFCIFLSHFLYLFKINNHWVFHINAIFSFFYIGNFFIKINICNRLVQILQVFLPIIFFLFLYLKKSILTFNSFGFGFYAFFIVLLCLLFYLQILKEPIIPLLYKDPTFLFVTAIFLYYVCSFVIFISYDILSSKGIKVGYLWRLHNVFVLIKIIIFTYAFTKQIKNELSNNINC